MTFLREVGAECGGKPLNPNELAAVVKVLDALTQLAARNFDADNLLVPNQGGILVRSSRCFLCTDRALMLRVDRNLLHLAHPSLSESVCAAVGIGELRLPLRASPLTAALRACGFLCTQIGTHVC